MLPLKDKRILITGGTGSLGQVLVRRLLTGEMGLPRKVIVFSRDEAKQHNMRVEYLHKRAVTDEVIYRNFEELLEFRIGDVFNAAALKQVPTCEYHPFSAVMTNIAGPENIVRAIQEHDLAIDTVAGISTDKACKPVNVMGMTKAIQERVFIQGNMRCSQTRFICVRYGNVLASRGSVIPLFHDQIRSGGPVTITTPDMTRFLLSLDQAVDTIFAAVSGGGRGETYIPRVPSARVIDIATALIGERPVETKVTGIRPGEKIHEILVSEEECHRTVDRGDYYAILPMLPELLGADGVNAALDDEYSSAHGVMTGDALMEVLQHHRLLIDDVPPASGEMLR